MRYKNHIQILFCAYKITFCVHLTEKLTFLYESRVNAWAVDIVMCFFVSGFEGIVEGSSRNLIRSSTKVGRASTD